MWIPALVGGMATIGVLVVAVPILFILGIKAFADLLAGAEVEDDTS